MEKQNIKWIDASKRHPKKGLAVLAICKTEKTDNFYYILCSFRKGAYWCHITGKCLIGENVVSKLDYNFKVDNVVCWTDPKVVCGFAEDILKQVKWD